MNGSNTVEQTEWKRTNWIRLLAKQRTKWLYKVEIWMLFCHITDHIFIPLYLKDYLVLSALLPVWCRYVSLCSTFSCLLWVTFQLYIWEHAEFCKGCHSKVSRNVSVSTVLSLSVFPSIFTFTSLFHSVSQFVSISFVFISSFFSLCLSLSAFLSCRCRSHNISLLNTPTLLFTATYNAQAHYMWPITVNMQHWLSTPHLDVHFHLNAVIFLNFSVYLLLSIVFVGSNLFPISVSWAFLCCALSNPQLVFSLSLSL